MTGDQLIVLSYPVRNKIHKDNTRRIGRRKPIVRLQ